METSLASDKELIIVLKSGSESSFIRLFSRYNERLFAFSFKLFQSCEDAEEVVQEVFWSVELQTIAEKNLIKRSGMHTIECLFYGLNPKNQT